jgi:stalled ribosome alternative rescue factor ArfA
VLFGLVFGLEFTRRLKGQGSHRRQQKRKQKQKSGEAGQDGLHRNAFFG